MKLFKKSQMFAVAVMAALITVFIPTQSFAAAGTPPDFTTLTSSIDFSTVITGILAVAGLLALVFVAIRGAKTLIGFIKAG